MIDGESDVGNQLVADESGALKPLVTTPLNLLADDERALHVSVNSGGSGRGGSFWAGASRCGRRALLAEAKYAHFRDIHSTLPLVKNHFLVGSLYHTMQETWRRAKHPFSDPSFSQSYVNVNVQEAQRLFHGYVANWDREFWGTTLAVEQQLPETPQVAERVKKIFQAELTGKVDLVVHLRAEHLARARDRLPEILTGRYIVDFKTAEMPGNGVGYMQGLQSLIYPYLWNLSYPHQPVDGIIFDVIYKRSRRKPMPFTFGDFGAYFAPFDSRRTETYADQLKGMVLQGKYTTDNNIPNRSECCSWRGDLCQFYQKECTGEF